MRIIKRIEKTQKAKTLLVADIETDKEGNLLDIGFYDGGYFSTFQTWESFLEYLPEKSEIFFHNGGRFDAVNAVSKISHNTNWIAVTAGTSIIRIEFTEKKIVFVDSINLMRSSLDDLAKSFKTESQKQDIPEEYKSNMSEYKKLFPNEYLYYLENDCISLYQILTKFSAMLDELFGIKHLPLTVASLAFLTYRKVYLEHDIFVPNERQDEYVRRGYYGGRVEYCGYGEITNGLYMDCTMIDVNSMYPSVMLENYPIGEYYYSDNFQKIVKQNKNKIPYGMYKVSYSIPENIRHSPFIGKKNKIGFEFSHSSNEAYLTHLDLELITKLGGEYKVIDFYYVLESAPIFKTYVLKLYELKSSSDKVVTLIAKYLLNSLYGKFGQKNTREQIINISVHDEKFLTKCVDDFNKKYDAGIEDFFELEYSDYFKNAKIMTETDENCILMYDVETPISRKNSNVLIASYVTARARIKLWEAMEKHNTIYVDTDSLITQSKIQVPVSKKLGDWGIEFIGVNVDVRGNKSYTLFDKDFKKTKSKNKGFKTFEIEEKELINEKIFSGTNTQPTSFRTWCRNNEISPSKFETKKRVNVRQLPTKIKSENPEIFYRYKDELSDIRKRQIKQEKIEKNKK